MTEIYPRVHFDDRSALKSILEVLLPETGPASRLEIFARQAGHDSDAEFRSCMRPPLEPDVLDGSLSWSVGQGVVLPLLVTAGLPLAGQGGGVTVEKILGAAKARLIAGEALRAPRPALLALPDIPFGPVRLFYARTMRELLFDPLEATERFWLVKTGEAFEGVALMMDSGAKAAGFDEDLLDDLVSRFPGREAPWQQEGFRALRQLQEMPPKTRSCIFQLMCEYTSAPRIQAAHERWRQPAAV